MSPATQRGTHILAGGLALGLVGDLLLPVEPWGLNLTICVTVLIGVGYAVVRRSATAPSVDAGWLALTALLLGAAFTRRDAELLQVLDFLALVGVLGLAAWAARGVTIRGKRLGEYVVALAIGGFEMFLGAPRVVFGEVAWNELPVHNRLKPARGVALGALIALPLLFLFGALFASADAVFSRTVNGLFDFDLGLAMGHAVRTGILSWFAAGYLRSTAPGLAFPARTGAAAPPSSANARVIPTLTALVLLDALFLTFVLVQLRYFFGGADRVAAVEGLTYAEYARSGFFELLSVASLVVPVLLAAEWAVRGAAPVAMRRFRLASGGMLGLLAVVVASALERMRLYVATFGLTEDRFYATAAMFGIVALLAWLGWTVLRGRGERFAFGALVQGLALLAGLHVANPDAFIVRYNLTRPAAERPFDVKYATTLSADAAPVLFAALPGLSADDACVAASRLELWSKTPGDWRSWNWSRARAARIGRDARVLEAKARCPATTPTSPTPTPQS